MTTRDPAQHVAALQKANRVRLGRAQLKRDVRAGKRPIEPILLRTAEPDVEIGDVLELTARVPVIELLQWQLRWGPRRAHRALWLLGIADSRQTTLTLEHLSPARRAALVGLLRTDAVNRVAHEAAA